MENSSDLMMEPDGLRRISAQERTAPGDSAAVQGTIGPMGDSRSTLEPALFTVGRQLGVEIAAEGFLRARELPRGFGGVLTTWRG